MIVAKTISQITSEITKLSSKKVALVPTMGALHAGHLSLIKKAKSLADIVIVSIFVNKTQFNNQGDYKNYPRQDLEDLEKLRNCETDLVFVPSEEEMLEKDISFKPVPDELTNCLCGSTRPGHFDGVALIITKLFKIVKPNLAVFGQKDFQQLIIIEKLAQELKPDLTVEISSAETFREESGLAMSSRNLRLSGDDKIKAAQIFKILSEIKNEAVSKPNKISEILSAKSRKLLKIGFEKIDYLEIREEDSLKLVTKLDFTKPSRIFIAVYLDGVRLIDNVPAF